MGNVVLVGLSGGVDSAAAGLLAREKWPDLPFFAIHQDLGWDDPAAEGDARAVAELIDAQITVQRTDIGEVWLERKYIPMAGMPCPASRQLKAEPAMLWAAETLGARYRGSWPDELGKPIFPLLAAGKNKDDARAIVRRYGLSIDYGGLPRRSCQPCIHWSSKEREILRTTRPDHAERVSSVEVEIGRTFDRRGPLISLPKRSPFRGEQESFDYVDGACGAWCR